MPPGTASRIAAPQRTIQPQGIPRLPPYSHRLAPAPAATLDADAAPSGQEERQRTRQRHFPSSTRQKQVPGRTTANRTLGCKDQVIKRTTQGWVSTNRALGGRYDADLDAFRPRPRMPGFVAGSVLPFQSRRRATGRAERILRRHRLPSVTLPQRRTWSTRPTCWLRVLNR